MFLVLSKIDTVSKEELIKNYREWQELFDFKEIIPISATTNDNIDLLLKTVKAYLPEGNMYYPQDHLTDHPERFVMAEFIREKFFILLKKKYHIVLQL